MSTGLIVLIIVVVVVLLALAFAMPRMRERARLRARERELGQRRDQAASGHRDQAAQLSTQADAAEQRVRIAEQEAARQRAQAQAEEERAQLHERGLADHELVSDDERERFAGTTAVPEGTAADDRDVAAADQPADAGETRDPQTATDREEVR